MPIKKTDNIAKDSVNLYSLRKGKLSKTNHYTHGMDFKEFTACIERNKVVEDKLIKEIEMVKRLNQGNTKRS